MHQRGVQGVHTKREAIERKEIARKRKREIEREKEGEEGQWRHALAFALTRYTKPTP